MKFDLLLDPGVRLWVSVNPTTYNCYVFGITQQREGPNTWSRYAATWTTAALYAQMAIYGPRPPTFPKLLDGSPFEEYGEAAAACESKLSLLAATE